ncbi:MAG: cytochrome c [Acidobacteria bacterium]|nr:cytochrome c [Acidobacteriota bacterium]MBI3427948.1 cytochrome c [Acidobacteriota bacterium]
MLRRMIAVAVLGFAVALALSVITSSGVTAQGKDKNAHGKQLYMTYCASCHGEDGKGGGPTAVALKAPLPDLTRIPKDKDGKFPALKMRNIIDGEVYVGGHGSREMPVWGRYFKERSSSQMTAIGNVYALMRYIESIQVQ